ncbi:MAG: hypothetical protein OSB70_17845 [Myxococcota bacterium]|nr:hypothetical protein [Myxococcota bacterium]
MSLAGFAFGHLYAESFNRSSWPFACFCASTAAYIFVVALDFNEHVRLEKFVTGRWLGWKVVPLGESALHFGIVGCLVVALSMSFHFTALDRIGVLIATIGFFGLGWCDELIYHRRRALHREDILHTVSHLTGGAVFATLFLSEFMAH